MTLQLSTLCSVFSCTATTYLAPFCACMYGNKLTPSILCFLVHGSSRCVLGLLAQLQLSTHRFLWSYISTHSDLSLFVKQHLSALHFVLHVKQQLGALCCSINGLSRSRSILLVQLQLGRSVLCYFVQQQLGALWFKFVSDATPQPAQLGALCSIFVCTATT